MHRYNRFDYRLKIISLKITESIGSPLSIILHSIVFAGIFLLRYFQVSFNDIMLILTTAVSLEAIYLSLFIQMSVNNNLRSIEGVEEDIDDIQQDMEETQSSIDVIEDNFHLLVNDVKEISGEVDRMQNEDEVEHKPNNHLGNVQTLLNKVTSDISFLEKDIEQLKVENSKKNGDRKK